MKILIADQLATSAIEALKNIGEILLDSSLKDDLLLESLQAFKPEILVVRSTKVNTEHIEKTPSLSLIIRAGAGVNTIALKTASEKGVFVANCPGKNAIAVAELVMGHLINLDRSLFENIRDFNAGIWNKKKYSKAKGLHGRSLALLGLGSIGIEVLHRAKIFGIEVRAWSRSLTPEKAKQLGITYASTPQEAANGADILSIHLPANAQTKDLIDHSILSVLNDDAFLINTSRGELVNEEDLLQAISEKNIRVGLDVFKDEPASNAQTVSSIFSENPSIYISHHIGASTNQATESVGWAVVEIIETWKKNGLVLNCVNLSKQTAATCCLSVRHADKVGILASVLEHVRADGLNIQEMDNIIFQGGKAACARIFLVGTPSDTLLTNLQANPDIFACSVS